MSRRRKDTQEVSIREGELRVFVDDGDRGGGEEARLLDPIKDEFALPLAHFFTE